MSVSGRTRRARPSARRNASRAPTKRSHPVRGRVGRALRRIRPARLAAALLVVLALGAAWLWLRGSSLVAVEQVKVTGLSGPGSARIRSALTAAARTMTTLDVRVSRLYTAVAPYPTVKSLEVAASFPHGLRIHVVEERPIAVLGAGARRVAVADDGAVLRGLRPKQGLPVVSVAALPVGPKLYDRGGRRELTVLAAAPTRLRTHVAKVLDTPSHGVVVALRAGPKLYFGAASSLHAKWLAASAVLGSATSAGAAYIDVTDPSRPAAG